MLSGPVHVGDLCFDDFDHDVDVEAPHDHGLQSLAGDVIVGCNTRDVVFEAEDSYARMEGHVVLFSGEGLKWCDHLQLPGRFWLPYACRVAHPGLLCTSF